MAVDQAEVLGPEVADPIAQLFEALTSLAGMFTKRVLNLTAS